MRVLVTMENGYNAPSRCCSSLDFLLLSFRSQQCGGNSGEGEGRAATPWRSRSADLPGGRPEENWCRQKGQVRGWVPFLREENDPESDGLSGLASYRAHGSHVSCQLTHWLHFQNASFYFPLVITPKHVTVT